MNTISLKNLILVLAAVLLTNGITAQNNQIRNYTLEDGLPQSQVFDVVQDEIGYLWVGSQGGGLSRFDGIQFKVWDEKNGLLSNYIQTLSFIGDRLFIGTSEGLSIKDRNTFKNYRSPQINKIFSFKEGTFLSTTKGIYRFKNNKLSKVNLPKLNNKKIHDILFDGTYYWLATNDGLWRTKAIAKNNNDLYEIQAGNFMSLVQYKKTVFAASFYHGVFLYEQGNLIPEVFPYAKRINTLTLLNENEIWISTDNKGIIVVDGDNLSIIRTIGKPNGLTVNNIKTCVKDKQSNIWIASSGGGLYRYYQNNFRHYNIENGLKGNRVYAVHENKNAIWASNSESGIIKIDTSGVRSLQNDTILHGVKIKTLASDYKGNLWAGTDGKGVFIINETIRDSVITNEDEVIDFQSLETIQIIETDIQRFPTEKVMPNGWIRKIVSDGNTMWIASYSEGIAKVSNNKRGFPVLQKIFTTSDGMGDVLINDMRLDQEGKLWYATRSGHLGYIHNDKVTHLGKALDVNVSIGTLLFKDNFIFLGTSGKGVWWSDLGSSLEFKKLNGRKDIYSKNIYQLIFDNEKNLWVGTEKGVDKVVLDDKNTITEVYHFGRNDGFLGIETCLNATIKDRSGNLWFGAIYGLTHYEPSERTTKNLKPVISFENVEVSYKPIDSIHYKTWTNNSKKVLNLGFRENNLAFSYRTIDINHPSEIRYRYRLNKEQWSPWSIENKVTLASLDYGSYTFEAQSRNKSWQKSRPIAFHFSIDTPLHKQVWFQRLGYGVLGFFILLFVLLYIRRVKIKNREERERLQLENHLLSLEQKALRLQMNPHFIFNVLNGIKAMGVHDKDKMNTTINKFAKLLRATLNNSRENYISLAQEIETLKNYIEVEQIMSEKPFDYTIDLIVDLDPEEILIPPMLIQPFVENAIKHGIMSIQEKGTLTIGFRIQNEFLHCEIIDNGIGIHQSQQAKKNTDHQSMALTVTKERIISISGKDTLIIEDLGDLDTNSSGTRVQFKIPLLTDY
ncbi:MAG: histidine kinase [Flavobacteriaceae bacterium]|nr:histidine kinase [Flavobacteriaceae bacterium]